MKMKKYVVVLLTALLIVWQVICNARYAYAASAYTKSEDRNFVFPIPEAGWSTLCVHVVYTEKYSLSTNQRNYIERTKSALYRKAYAATCPSLYLDNVTHSNGNVFNSWSRDSIMYGSDWDGGISYTNSTEKCYSMSSKVQGTLHYRVVCSGAIVPTRTGSICQNLY